MDIINELQEKIEKDMKPWMLVKKTDMLLLVNIAKGANIVGDQILAGEMIPLEVVKEIVENSSLQGKIEWGGLQRLAIEKAKEDM